MNSDFTQNNCRIKYFYYFSCKELKCMLNDRLAKSLIQKEFKTFLRCKVTWVSNSASEIGNLTNFDDAIKNCCHQLTKISLSVENFMLVKLPISVIRLTLC